MTDKISTECPDCGSTVRFTLDDVAMQRTVRCMRGHEVKMRDLGGGARKASKALNNLDDALKKFSKSEDVKADETGLFRRFV